MIGPGLYDRVVHSRIEEDPTPEVVTVCAEADRLVR